MVYCLPAIGIPISDRMMLINPALVHKWATSLPLELYDIDTAIAIETPFFKLSNQGNKVEQQNDLHAVGHLPLVQK